jgi:hypothetical protein
MPIPLGVLAVAGAGAAGGGNSFDLLETTLISTNTASVTFSNLGNYSDYKHLQIRGLVRSSDALTPTVDLRLTFNSDTANNYASHQLGAAGSSVVSENQINFPFITINEVVPQSSSTASSFGAFITDILDFANTNKFKTTRSFAGSHTSTETQIYLGSGLWRSTNAITSLTLLVNAQDLVSGCRVSLYGIK